MAILWASSMPLNLFNMYYDIIIQDNNQFSICYLIESEDFWLTNCSSNTKNADNALKFYSIQHFNFKKQIKFSFISGNQWKSVSFIAKLAWDFTNSSLLLSDKGMFITEMLTVCQPLTTLCLPIVCNIQPFGYKFSCGNYYVLARLLLFGL